MFKSKLLPFVLLIITVMLIFLMPDDKAPENEPVITENSKIYSENAHKLLRMHRYDEALENVTKALEITPNHAGWHFLSALIHLQMKNNVKTFEELALTLKYRPNDVEAYFLSGLLHFREADAGNGDVKKEYDSARSNFDKALLYAPEHIHTNYFLGRINLIDGAIDKALENFLIGKKHTRHTEHMKVGLSKKEEAAIDYLVYYYIGLTYAAQNKLEDAIESMKIATVGGAGGQVNFDLGKTIVKFGKDIDTGLLYVYRGSLLFYHKELNRDSTAETLAFVKQTAPQSEYVSQIEEMMSKPPVKPKKSKRNYG